jgi:hypothetical protein
MPGKDGLCFSTRRLGRRALALDRRQRVSHGLGAYVAVAREHLPGDVAGDLHDGLVARAGCRKLGDQCVPVVVPAHSIPTGGSTFAAGSFIGASQESPNQFMNALSPTPR